MSDTSSVSSLQKNRIAIGWVFLATWCVYLATLFPILDDYLSLSIFTLIIAALGLIGAMLALRGHQLWISVSSTAAGLLIIRYIIYWYGIREHILADSPEMSTIAVLGKIAKSGGLVFEHKLAQGEVLGATLTMINEFVMPLLQIGIVVIVAVVSIMDRQQKGHG